MRIKLILGILLYYLFLNVSYVYIISPNFSYMGYINNSPSLSVLFISSIFALAPCIWLPIKVERSSTVVCWILYLFVAIPASFVPIYTLFLPEQNLIILEVFIMLNVVLMSIMGKLPLIKLPKIELNPRTFWICIICISMIFYTYIFIKLGFNFKLSGLDDAYDLRYAYREESDKLARYFINWQTKVINPLLIAIGLFTRKIPIISIGFFGQLVLFSISGHKAYLFTPLLILGLWIGFKNNGRNFGIRVVYGILSVVIFTLVLDLILNSSSLTSMFVRRMIVTPALLTGYYYNFFLEHPVVIWGHSFLKGIIDYPYTLNPPFVIGQYYFGDSRIAANANLWADGIANLSFLGMFINTIVLGGILLVYDSISVNLDKTLMGMLLGVSAWNLADTALFTTILTHGIFLVVLIAFIMPKELTDTVEKKSSKILRKKVA